MKLSFEQIKAVTTGAADVKSVEGGFSFFRFSEAERECYEKRSETFFRNTSSTAGVKLRFETDSENLSVGIFTAPGSSRRYFSLDVSVDGEIIGSIDNFSDREVPQNFHAMSGELGEASRSFSLGSGLKEVCLTLPWSVITTIRYIELDDGAQVKPIKRAKKLLAFGDSITQGYDSLRPTSRHIAKLCDMLGADELNKAIGGERFWSCLSSFESDYDPDYIIVAYGTNDWRHVGDTFTKDYDSFFENCNDFFENVRKNYPDAKIFAITPLWRKDIKNYSLQWSFEETEEVVRKAAESRGITVICGTELIPHDENMFGDMVLHPNDKGFEFYSENLYNAIKSEL